MFSLCVFVHVCVHVRVDVCVMKQMVFRPLCAIEKSPYVFSGLTKYKHMMLCSEKNTDMLGNANVCEH